MGNDQIIKETNRGKKTLVQNVALYVINVWIDIQVLLLSKNGIYMRVTCSDIPELGHIASHI